MICNIKSDICSCNSSSSTKKKSGTKSKKSKPKKSKKSIINETEDISDNCKTFPPISSDISNKPDI